MVKGLVGLVLLAMSLVVPGTATALIFQIDTVKNLSTAPLQRLYTVSNNVLTTSDGGDPLTVGPFTPPAVLGKTFHLEIKLDGTETAGTAGTRFVGAAPEGLSDITISDGGTLLLALDVNFIEVTSLGGFPPVITNLTLGGLTGELNSDLEVTGGTLAGDFGGIGAAANMKIVLSMPYRAPGTIFQSDITGTAAPATVANITLYVDPPASPEPSSLLLLGAGVVGLAVRLRSKRRAA
jgi:hypothetical protein